MKQLNFLNNLLRVHLVSSEHTPIILVMFALKYLLDVVVSNLDLLNALHVANTGLALLKRHQNIHLLHKPLEGVVLVSFMSHSIFILKLKVAITIHRNTICGICVIHAIVFKSEVIVLIALEHVSKVIDDKGVLVENILLVESRVIDKLIEWSS